MEPCYEKTTYEYEYYVAKFFLILYEFLGTCKHSLLTRTVIALDSAEVSQTA